MSRDSGSAPKSKRHHSRISAPKKQTRKVFHSESISSSASSNGNSSARSEDDNGVYSRQSVKKISVKDKDVQVKKLQLQVKDLRHKLRVLEECTENKEYSLGTLMRDKDRAFGEVRRLERSNKQLKQQLNDERNHYLEEKEKFCSEMTRYKKRLQGMKMIVDSNKSIRYPAASKVSVGSWQKGDSAEIEMLKNFKIKKSGYASGSNISGTDFKKSNSVDSLGLYEGQDLSLQMAALRTENAKLKAIINEHEERNYDLCLRFLRMKHSKIDLRNRFQDLENEYLQVITNLMEKIDEAREEFNFIIDQKFKMPLHSTNAKYLKTIQRNSKIAFENITLRMELQNLKKELGKSSGGQYDPDSKAIEEEPMRSPNEDGSKIVNFQRRRPMLDEMAGLKASDTDSNYLSKTSTTAPSTGSPANVKSNESVFADTISPRGQDNRDGNKQSPLFTEDILNKIFKRVDSGSSLNSPRDLNQSGSKGNLKSGGKRKSAEKVKSSQETDEKDVPLHVSENAGKRYIPCSLNSKKFHRILSNSVTKKIIRRDKVGPTAPDPSKPKKEKPAVEERAVKTRSRYTEIKDRIRSYSDSDKTADSPKQERCETSWREKPAFDRSDSPEYHHGSRRYRSKKERRHRVRDSCGLEEKLDTDLDVPLDYEYDNPISGRSRMDKVVDQLALMKYRASNSARDRIRQRTWHQTRMKDEQDGNSEESALETASVGNRNRNSVSLHDELMEATKSQSRTDDPFWRRELNLHSLITKKSASSSRTYKLGVWNTRFLSECLQTSDVNIPERKRGNVTQAETKVLRKDHSEEHRSENGAKIDGARSKHSVTYVTTGTDPILPTETNSEVVLRFLMPPAAIESTQSLMLDETYQGSSILQSEKEQGSQIAIVQTHLSHLILPASNIPSSSSTVELADYSGARGNGLTSRTLSAPALLESEWLNTFKLCEMKDCSTNT